MPVSESFKNFVSCLGQSRFDAIKQKLANFKLNLNPSVSASSPALSGLQKKLTDLNRLQCIQTYTLSVLTNLKNQFLTDNADIITCLSQAFSPEALRLKLAFDTTINQITNTESQLNTLIAQLNTQISDTQTGIQELKSQADLAVEIEDGLEDVPYYTSYKTDKSRYNPGQIINIELETNLNTEILLAGIPRPDLATPLIEPILDSAITKISDTKFLVQAQVPPNINDIRFRIKFSLQAIRKDACIFFIHFDRDKTSLPGSLPNYVVRPCT